MNILLGIVIGFLALIALLYVIGLFLPRTWRVERRERIHARPEAIYPLIANFQHGWSRWNPFGKRKHPGLEMIYSGPEEGPGAKQSWTGKGAPPGKISITEAVPNKSVRYVMNTAGFEVVGDLSFEPDGEHTIVVWSDGGTIANPLFRFATLLVERTVGKPFEEGLATLKQEVESKRQSDM